MPQDPFERVQTLLSETRVNPLAMLLDLTSLLPESLLRRAISLALHTNEDVLRAFLLRALAKRLPTKVEQIELTKEHPVPRGTTLKEVSVPEGKEAKRLIAKLPDDQRHEVFDHLLVNVETTQGLRKGAKRARKKNGGGGGSVFGIAEPPDNQGGGSPFEGEISLVAGVDPEGNRIKEEDRSAAASVIRIPTSPAAEDDPELPAGLPKERNDIVNLGFSHANAADNALKKFEPLQRGTSYYFWLRIGKELEDAIGTATRIDLDKLPEEAVLTVAVFGFENELAITPGQDVGELKIQKNGSVKVLRKPTGRRSIPLSTDPPSGYLEDFLLFPIRVPDTEGMHRLRCNIYCSQVLVQSYVVSADVSSTFDLFTEACTKTLDYVLSQNLRAGHLASLTAEPHRLSLMLNNNGDGTHSFRFFGADGKESYKDDAQVDGQLLEGFLKQARRAMHKVSWGDENEWDSTKGLKYRYPKKKDSDHDAFDPGKLAKDLAYLARAGWRIYAGFLLHLTRTAAELEAIMANPGLVQIALKLSPKAVLPAAVVYDYAWKPDKFADAWDTTDWKICPTFLDAIEKARAGGPPLENCECFKGGCALKKMIAEIKSPDSDKTLEDLPPVICPSGFWGYRHSLGLPLTLDGTNKDIPPVIEVDGDLQMFACVSTDQDFAERDPHLGRLKDLKENALKFERDEGYTAMVKRLRKAVPHVLYFYCHGGVRANTNLPYLEIGKSDRFGPEDLIGEDITWKGPHPLVFINGCHTTSLNPEITLDFVSSFVRKGGAAGVMGTEITIFEPLATRFAEECFARFVGAPPHNESMPIGRAVRGARLELLKEGNPLGLVYIPYAVGTLRLQTKN